jgi:arylformamidase
MKQSTATEQPAEERGWRPDVIDLTRPLTLETVYALFGDLVADEESYFRQIRITTAVDFTTANATSCYLSIPDHVGTHMDVPVHTVEGGYMLEEADISRLIGTAVVLDLDRGGIDYAYTADDLEGAAPGVEAGDIVLVYSGFRDARVTERMRQTYFTVEAAEWLVERGVRAVGIEPCSPDHVHDGLFVHGWADPANRPAWPIHGAFLGNEVYIVEGLTNLDRIKGRRVNFAALPLLVPGLSGSPVRAVAWLDPPTPASRSGR